MDKISRGFKDVITGQGTGWLPSHRKVVASGVTPTTLLPIHYPFLQLTSGLLPHWSYSPLALLYLLTLCVTQLNEVIQIYLPLRQHQLIAGWHDTTLGATALLAAIEL